MLPRSDLVTNSLSLTVSIVTSYYRSTWNIMLVNKINSMVTFQKGVLFSPRCCLEGTDHWQCARETCYCWQCWLSHWPPCHHGVRSSHRDSTFASFTGSHLAIEFRYLMTAGKATLHPALHSCRQKQFYILNLNEVNLWTLEYDSKNPNRETLINFIRFRITD